jgi:hypothetical protein
VLLLIYSFSHFVHHPRHFNHGQHNATHRSPFIDIYLKEENLFLYGLALPLALVTLASVMWNPSTSNTNDSSITSTNDCFPSFRLGRGDVNVKKWTIVCYLLLLLLIMYDASREHPVEAQDDVVEDYNTASKEYQDRNDFPSFLTVAKGCPPVENVIRNVLKAKRPGVYMCGPIPLMGSVEGSIQKQRTDCAFYREDSEL